MREDVRTKRALAKLVRHPTVTMKGLAEDLRVAYRTVANWVEPDGPVPTLAQVRSLVWAAARQDAEAARELALDLFGLSDAGWVLVASPEPAPGASDVVKEVLEAGVAMGGVQAETVAAVADGVVTPAEAHRLDLATRRAMRELADVQERMGRIIRPRLPLSAGVSA